MRTAHKLLLLSNSRTRVDLIKRLLFGDGSAGGLWIVWPGFCFQDTACTIPSAVGDPVGGVLDLSGNAHSLVQGTSNNRPILRDGGGFYYLEFDGSNDTLAAPSSKTYFRFLHDGTGMTMGVGAASTGATSPSLFGTQNSTTLTGARLTRVNASSRPQMLVTMGSASVFNIQSSGAPWPADTFGVSIGTYKTQTGTDGRLYFAGAEVSTGSEGNSPDSGDPNLDLTLQINATQAAKCSFAFAVAREMSAVEMLSVAKMLAPYSGLSL